MAPLEMNAGTCWEQEYKRPKMASVLKKLQKATFTFLPLYIYIYIYIYNLNQGCTNLRCQVALVTKFCTVAPNVYESILSMELALYHLTGI